MHRTATTRFLAEAVLLTSAGGLLGIALGATVAVERFTPLPTLLTGWPSRCRSASPPPSAPSDQPPRPARGER